MLRDLIVIVQLYAQRANLRKKGGGGEGGASCTMHVSSRPIDMVDNLCRGPSLIIRRLDMCRYPHEGLLRSLHMYVQSVNRDQGRMELAFVDEYTGTGFLKPRHGVCWYPIHWTSPVAAFSFPCCQRTWGASPSRQVGYSTAPVLCLPLLPSRVCSR